MPARPAIIRPPWSVHLLYNDVHINACKKDSLIRSDGDSVQKKKTTNKDAEGLATKLLRGTDMASIKRQRNTTLTIIRFLILSDISTMRYEEK